MRTKKEIDIDIERIKRDAENAIARLELEKGEIFKVGESLIVKAKNGLYTYMFKIEEIYKDSFCGVGFDLKRDKYDPWGCSFSFEANTFHKINL